MSFLSMLNRTCEIRAPKYDPDGMGGQIETLAVVATGVPCSIDAIGAQEGIYYQRLGVNVTHLIYMQPQKPEIDELHQLILDDGHEYNVLGIKDVGGRQRIWIVEVERTK